MMTRCQFVFKMIDVVYYPLQNGAKFENVAEIKDIEYVPGGGKDRSGNVYFDKTLAARGRRFPVVVYIHGGGFLKGDKDYRKSVCEYFAHNGYFVWDINYRMPPEIVFPEMLRDCVDGVNYLEALAGEYNLDMDKIVITGDSSGGYLSVYTTALSCDENLCKELGVPEVRVKFAALAPCCGIYDMNLLMAHYMPLEMIQQMLGMLIGMHIDRDMKNIAESPWYKYLSPGDFANDRWPAAYVIWSEKDILCGGQGPRMAAIMEQHCPAVGTFSVPEVWNNHCYHLIWRTASARRAMSGLLKFLKAQGIG